ncbi:transmembrane sensor kinase protein [Ralstonia solanacearum IPO1609]|uniref:Transmembrane sensor kinase protein n=1 Tax=Ralstonia solanacearum IPO1609 TaxID=564066 RepID=A0A7U7JEW5_RALSL|nr:transmembrane sensor kinase protein [Ralstonia solanacearum IPO1609]
MRARPARAHAERDARVTCRRQVNVAIEPAADITATLDVAALRPWPAPSI